MQDHKAEAQALHAEHFPEDLLAPWRQRVKSELGDKWEAKVLPHLGGPDEFVHWYLERVTTIGAVRARITLTDVSQDALIKVARGAWA